VKVASDAAPLGKDEIQMEDGERCAHSDFRRTYGECQEPDALRFLAIGDAGENEIGWPEGQA